MTTSDDQVTDIIADPELRRQFKQLVLERISTMPETLRVAVGASQLAPHDMAEHVRSEDEIGRQVMEIELEFLRDLATGAVYGSE